LRSGKLLTPDKPVNVRTENRTRPLEDG
jgi:hypothetical protein